MLLKPCQPFGNQANNLIRFHHTDVQVGHQGKSSTPLASTTIQHQRAGLGDGHSATSHNSIAVVKLVTAPQPAEELRARILRYIAGERRPEFTDIRILRSPADFHPSMPRFVPAYLSDFWSRQPLSAG